METANRHMKRSATPLVIRARQWNAVLFIAGHKLTDRMQCWGGRGRAGASAGAGGEMWVPATWENTVAVS